MTHPQNNSEEWEKLVYASCRSAEDAVDIVISVKEFLSRETEKARQEEREAIIKELRFYGYGDMLDKFEREKKQNELTISALKNKQ